MKLHRAALELAQRLQASELPAERWVGKDVARQLAKPAVQRRIERRERA
jgi:hypothetical protein